MKSVNPAVALGVVLALAATGRTAPNQTAQETAPPFTLPEAGGAATVEVTFVVDGFPDGGEIILTPFAAGNGAPAVATFTGGRATVRVLSGIMYDYYPAIDGEPRLDDCIPIINGPFLHWRLQSTADTEITIECFF